LPPDRLRFAAKLVGGWYRLHHNQKRPVGRLTSPVQSGLVTFSCRSPISLCHLGFECERADAAQI
jgi:hypothetical protein